jgi:MFS family permease
VFDLPRDDPYITSEVAAIRHALSIESGVVSHLALFKKDKIHTRRRVALAYFGLFMNQMVGINLVVYYMPTVLVTNVGLEARTAQIIGGCINIMFIVGNTAPALALDRMGRRPTMIYGCAGLGICMMLASILLSFGQKNTSSAAIAFFFIYMVIFGGECR